MITAYFNGVSTATITPFTDSGGVDYDSVDGLVEYQVAGGVKCLCPCGTTGEMLYLEDHEKAEIIRRTVIAAGSSAAVMAGVWAFSSPAACKLARSAEESGAKGVFLPPPIYYPADDDVIFQWYAAIRNSTSLPIFAYNIPGYAANAISLNCVERLTADGIIQGIKDSTGKSDQMKTLAERFGRRLVIEAASDGFVLEAREIGADGFISALSNIWPGALCSLWNGTDAIQDILSNVRNAVKSCGGIPAIKYLVSKKNAIRIGTRLPFGDLSTEEMVMLESTFHEADAKLKATT